MFISFRFSLIQPIKSRFWLAPDTIAVAMNFLSGIFVFVFGLGLVKEVMNFFGKKESKTGLIQEAIHLISKKDESQEDAL